MHPFLENGDCKRIHRNPVSCQTEGGGYYNNHMHRQGHVKRECAQRAYQEK